MSTGAAAAIGMVAILFTGFWCMYALGRMHGESSVRRTAVVTQHPTRESFGPYYGKCFHDAEARVSYCAQDAEDAHP